jgi:hypothetical protein
VCTMRSSAILLGALRVERGAAGLLLACGVGSAACDTLCCSRPVEESRCHRASERNDGMVPTAQQTWARVLKAAAYTYNSACSSAGSCRVEAQQMVRGMGDSPVQRRRDNLQVLLVAPSQREVGAPPPNKVHAVAMSVLVRRW